MSMQELKVAFAFSVNTVWVFTSDLFCSFIISPMVILFDPISGLTEHAIDFWVKTVVYVVGAVILWYYSIRKIKHTKASEMKDLAETEKLRHEIEAIKLDNQIGKETFHNLSLEEVLYREETIKKQLGEKKYNELVQKIKTEMGGSLKQGGQTHNED